MKVGLFAVFVTPHCGPEVVAATARSAEERGYDSFWVGEHLAFFDSYEPAYPGSDDGRIPIAPTEGMPDPLLLLTAAATVTSRIRLATGICLLPQRSLPYTAKEVATLDWLSGGRVDFGVGVGWQREEFDAAGVPWERRGARTDEYLDALVALWTSDPSSFDGEFVRFAPCRLHPKPASDPHTRLIIGGHAPAALRRTARIGDGWFGWYLDPTGSAQLVAQLADEVAAAGRTMADVEITVQVKPGQFRAEDIAAFAEAGVQQLTLMVRPTSVDHAQRALDKMQPLADAVRQG